MKLREIFYLFLKVNLFSFGGPNIGISILENELVKNRKLLKEDEFQKIFITTNIVPGPVFIQLSYLIGYKLNKFKGAAVALITSIMVVPILSIFTYFYLQNIISSKVMNNFILLMSPIIIIFISEFILNQLKKTVKKISKIIIIYEISLTLFLTLIFGFSTYLNILLIITSLYIFRIIRFTPKEEKEESND